MKKDSKNNTNIKFSYTYRDAGNNKIHGFVVFSNPENLSIDEIGKKISENLIDSLYFYPERINIPSLFFEKYSRELDSSWNEFEGVEILKRRLPTAER
jgi:hypothetical protein